MQTESGEERAETFARQLCLRNEPPHRVRRLEPLMERLRRPAGCEHDNRTVATSGQTIRDRKAVDPRKLDVEQHHLRPQAPRRLQRGVPIRGLSDDIEAVNLEQCSRSSPEVGVVVDDQQAPAHETIVSSVRRAVIGAVPKLSLIHI